MKKIAANVIADAVADNLFRVELTPAVHKYIGETKKHLFYLEYALSKLDADYIIDQYCKDNSFGSLDKRNIVTALQWGTPPKGYSFLSGRPRRHPFQRLTTKKYPSNYIKSVRIDKITDTNDIDKHNKKLPK